MLENQIEALAQRKAAVLATAAFNPAESHERASVLLAVQRRRARLMGQAYDMAAAEAARTVDASKSSSASATATAATPSNVNAPPMHDSVAGSIIAATNGKLAEVHAHMQRADAIAAELAREDAVLASLAARVHEAAAPAPSAQTAPYANGPEDVVDVEAKPATAHKSEAAPLS